MKAGRSSGIGSCTPGPVDRVQRSSATPCSGITCGGASLPSRVACAFRKWWNLSSGMIRSALGDPNAWESSIRKFEAQDRLQPPTSDGIVFVGSSTFTLWTTLEEDMSPLNAINRGFGGSRIADVARYLDRIVLPCKPKAIVLFAGTNDIAGRKPATAQEVYEGYVTLVRRVKRALPGTRIYYVAISPTPSRWRYWGIACEANRLIREHSTGDGLLRFIDPTAKFMGSDGKPDRSLFRMDRLHPNKRGYAILKEAIKPAIEADMGPANR
jgi:lysophospholipase L1-like esterase